MPLFLEYLIVALIVGGAIAFLLWKFWPSSSKKTSSACGSGGCACPSKLSDGN